MSHLLPTLIGFSCAFIIGLYVVPRLIIIAHRFGITDKPNGFLKQHETATAYLGGLGVYLAFLATLVLTYPLQHAVLWLILGGTALLILGLVDDLIDLSPSHKFIGHMVTAACFLYAGMYLRTSLFPWWLSLALSFVWMLTIINAFNLVDVMDGLSSTIALGSAAGFLAVAWYAEQHAIVLLIAIFMGALSAFWWHNKPPARIYLGDSGSLFIGGFFAAMPFLINWEGLHQYGFFVPPVLLALPLAEVVILILIRRYKGIPFYKGSRDHFVHYLQARGWSTRGILYLVAALSLVLAVLALLFLANIIPLVEWVALGAVSAAAWLIFVYYL